MIITIDGPSGTGKTTVAREVANRLQFVYFDTGAMYRAFTWLVLKNNVDVMDVAEIERLLATFEFNIIQEEGHKRYFTNGEDVTETIRSRPITAFVSQVSALKPVRDALLHIQHHFASGHNAVFEGRDLGSVVFPNAEVKIFLDADPQVRAERRLAEMVEKRPQDAAVLSKEEMLADLVRRDTYDSNREVAPLRCPADAFKMDTTLLTIEEVVNQIVDYAHKTHPQHFVL